MTVNKMPDQCPLCERPKQSSSEFCDLHSAAYANLESTYTAWSKAHGGNLSKQEYFSELDVLAETGPAVKEVIQQLRGKGAVN